MSPQQILTSVMTRIVVDKSTYHAKPHSICFFTTISKITKEIFAKHGLESARAALCK